MTCRLMGALVVGRRLPPHNCFVFCPVLRSEDVPVVYRCQETTLCKRARLQVSMPMPTGWDVRCAVGWGSVGGLAGSLEQAGLVAAVIGGRRSIDGRQWSCACSSVQLCAPENANADASTPGQPGQVSVPQGVMVLLLLLLLLCVEGSTGGSIRAADWSWFNFLLTLSCCWFLGLELKVPVLNRRGKWRKGGPRYPRGKRGEASPKV